MIKRQGTPISLLRANIRLGNHPLEILNHSMKYGYTALADSAANLAASQPDRLLVEKLTYPGVLQKLVSY